MKKHLRFFAGMMLALACSVAAAAGASISFATPQGPMVVTAYDYTAGAICSLTWNGKEFIDAADHGRCLQSASVFDGKGEAFNPTEAGSLANGNLPNPSTSVLNAYTVTATVMQTTNTMAYWNPVNGVALSKHIHTKKVTAGYNNMPGVIEHQVTFKLPAGEPHTLAQFEILTGYMPNEFGNFYTISTTTGNTSTLAKTPAGEQPDPIIFATAGGTHAMGVWSPQTLAGGGYGRWQYWSCVKWNMVARVSNPTTGGSYSFRVFVVVGTTAEVKARLTTLYATVPHDAVTATPFVAATRPAAKRAK